MNYTLIIKPLIGALIGYVTNFIAVKMLFRPLRPIKIGNFTLPFTPGIIPKNKEKLAESIGNSISENLLTEETLKSNLLSENIKNEFKEKINKFIDISLENTTSLENSICKYISSETYSAITQTVNKNLTSSIFETVRSINLGNIVAEQIKISAKEGIKGSLLGLIGGNSILSSISNTASLKINFYIEENGKKIISDMVSSEIEKFNNTSISSIAIKTQKSNLDLLSIIMNIYENFIIQELPQILKTLNIAEIIKNKINEMNVLELEKLILNIMKKELRALINLGAIIGFILGLLNLLF